MTKIRHSKTFLILLLTFALTATLAVIARPEAQAAPCPWGTNCNTVTLIAPTTGTTLSGTANLSARAVQATPARGNIVKVEWWLYHPSFLEQVPQNHEGKILLYEALAPASGTRLDGVWNGTWTVASSMTTRDGAYELSGTRTYTLPNDGRQYSIEAHVLDEEWVRTWGGPSGRSGPANVTINFGGAPPPPPPPPSSTDVTINGQKYPLAGTNIPRAANALVRYTRVGSQTVSPANQWGVEVSVVDDKVVEVRSRYAGAAAMPIPVNGYVLSGHDAAGAFLTANAAVGRTVTLPGGTPPVEPPPTPGANEVVIGTARHNLAGVNIFRAAGTLVQYTRTGSQTVSPANQWGVEATVVNGVVTEMHRGLPASPIPSNGYVLSGHDGAGDWLFANAKVGAAVQLGGSTPPPPGTLQCAPGWDAKFYPNTTLSGTPSLERCDQAITYAWPGTQGPVAAFGGSNFSAKWATKITVTARNDYAFTVTADDGVRVKIDGVALIDQWKDQGPTTYTATQTLTVGEHLIEVEYYEKFGDASISFTYNLAGSTPPPVGGTGGTWTVVPVNNPVRAIHATLLRDGRVLLIAGSGADADAFAAGTFKSTIWNPTNNTFKDVPTPADMFCSGHVTLADGKVLVAGGTLSYPGVNGEASYKGAKFSYLFDPATDVYTRTNDMQEGHWYPTLTKIENGDVWAAGGYSDRGDGYSINTEMFRASEGRWLTNAEVPQAMQNWGTYPHMFLMADGRMFYTGGHTFGYQKWNAPGGAQVFDWRTGQVGDIYGLRDKELRDQSGSVLLAPAQNQQFMIAGGGATDNGGATNKVDIVDMKTAQPEYRPTQDLPGPGRMYLNLTLLPDRTVLASNGGTFARGGNVAEAATYNPATSAWTSVSADPIGRNYHSSSLLLPDGRVAVFGSNPADGSYEARISVFSPYYMNTGGARPTITTVSTGGEATYGEQFTFGVTGTTSVASLISPGSSTHQTDTNARVVDLPITGTGATRTATVPTNPALLPPGPYMMVVQDANGIPSVAKWINIR